MTVLTNSLPNMEFLLNHTDSAVMMPGGVPGLNEGGLKKECTAVNEPTYMIWQDFEATRQMGEFSFKH